MSDMRRWLTDAEIAASKEIASRDPADKQRHHFVPQMYLKRWLNGIPNVQWRDIVQGRTGFGPPRAVACQPHFYSYNSPDDPSLWFETHLSRIENDAAKLLQDLDSLADGQITDQATIDNIAVFVGLQSQRTPRVRSVNNAIESWNPTGNDPQTAAIDMAIYAWRTAVVPHFSARTCWLVSSTRPLVTCDEPVLHLGYPDWTRKKRLSLMTTALLLFPIGPHRLLILAAGDHTRVSEPFELTAAETDAVNLEMAANCLQFTYEQHNTSIVRHLPVPAGTSPIAGEDANIFLATNLDTRWSAADQAPPWPLSHWVSSTPPLLRTVMEQQVD
ncbi:DUF4238 domain-containing protein [Nocardia asteroides]|uniref:DUF4238 domain-containing protein n=1 Tax=Nocardia asteroides TaxID=1824 RepID=UPI00341D10BC